MSAPFECHRCGHALQVADDRGAQFVSCPKCGSYTTVPGSDQSEGYECEDPFKNCPHCEKELPAKAVLCNGCGYNFKTGRRINARRNVTPFYRHWGSNMPLRLAVAGVATLLLAPLVLVAERPVEVVALCCWPVFMLLSAGTFRTATLSRERRGRCDLWTRQWVAFVPMPGRHLLLDRRCMTVEPHAEGVGLAGWGEALMDSGPRRGRALLLPFMLLFYGYTRLAVGTCVLKLADDRGSRVERFVIYRCRGEEQMREVGDALCEVAGLSYS